MFASRSPSRALLASCIFGSLVLVGPGCAADAEPLTDDELAVPDDLGEFEGQSAWQSVWANLPANSEAARLGAKTSALLYQIRPGASKWPFVFLLRGPGNVEWMRIAFTQDLAAGLLTKAPRVFVEGLKVSYTAAGVQRFRTGNQITKARTETLIRETMTAVRAAFKQKARPFPMPRASDGLGTRAVGNNLCDPYDASFFTTGCVSNGIVCGGMALATFGAAMAVCSWTLSASCGAVYANTLAESAECHQLPRYAMIKYRVAGMRTDMMGYSGRARTCAYTAPLPTALPAGICVEDPKSFSVQNGPAGPPAQPCGAYLTARDHDRRLLTTAVQLAAATTNERCGPNLSLEFSDVEVKRFDSWQECQLRLPLETSGPLPGRLVTNMETVVKMNCTN
jgi:hypothetical protein